MWKFSKFTVHFLNPKNCGVHNWTNEFLVNLSTKVPTITVLKPIFDCNFQVWCVTFSPFNCEMFLKYKNGNNYVWLRQTERQTASQSYNRGICSR